MPTHREFKGLLFNVNSSVLNISSRNNDFAHMVTCWLWQDMGGYASQCDNKIMCLQQYLAWRSMIPPKWMDERIPNTPSLLWVRLAPQVRGTLEPQAVRWDLGNPSHPAHSQKDAVRVIIWKLFLLKLTWNNYSFILAERQSVHIKKLPHITFKCW